MIKTKLTIGSDPELSLWTTDNNRRENAQHIIQVENAVEIPFGLDGSPDIAELRPEPATDPIKHAQNIKNILLSYYSNPDYRKAYSLNFMCSAMDHGIGGHIHFGHPTIKEVEEILVPRSPQNASEEELLAYNKKIDLTYQKYEKMRKEVDLKRSDLINTLDNLLALPLLFVEIPEHARERRLHSSYGRLGDFRGKPYGIEYRPLPSWLANERLATGTLCLAYAIAYQSLEKGLIYTKLIETNGVKNAYQNAYLDLLNPYLEKAKKTIRRELELYPTYQKEIDYLLLSATRHAPLLKMEIKTGWHIPFIKIKAIILLSARKLAEKLTEELAKQTSLSARRDLNAKPTDLIQFNSPTNDYQIPEIAFNVNQAIRKTYPDGLPTEASEHKVKIYGLRRSRGNEIIIEYDPFTIKSKRARRLERMIYELLKKFDYNEEIIVKRGTCRYLGTAGNGRADIKIGLPRQIREQQTFLSELL